MVRGTLFDESDMVAVAESEVCPSSLPPLSTQYSVSEFPIQLIFNFIHMSTAPILIAQCFSQSRQTNASFLSIYNIVFIAWLTGLFERPSWGPASPIEDTVDLKQLSRLVLSSPTENLLVDRHDHARSYCPNNRCRPCVRSQYWKFFGVSRLIVVSYSGIGAIEQFKRKGFNVVAYDARSVPGGLWRVAYLVIVARFNSQMYTGTQLLSLLRVPLALTRTV